MILTELHNQVFTLTEVFYKPGLYFETWLSESEINMLKSSGVPYEITITDWMQYYNSISQMSPQQIQEQMKQSADVYNVTHSIYGTMGGHLTYTQMVNKLDSMRMEYPNFISAKFSIGNSVEGRAMWTIRVTKNPDAPTGRPEIWFNGVTHAREPMGFMNVFYYLYWLLENYNIDPIATYILTIVRYILLRLLILMAMLIMNLQILPVVVCGAKTDIIGPEHMERI